MRREKQGYLYLEDIRQFPCQDLRIIDQLWINYSNGHFGFSVQKEIYLSVRGILETQESQELPYKKVFSLLKQIYVRLGAGNRDSFKAFCRFSDRVEWRVNKKWKEDDTDINYDISAKKGHLPAKIQLYLSKYLQNYECPMVFSRINTCQV